MPPQTYTLTGASDWPMMLALIGGVSLFFYAVVIAAIRGWIREVTAAIKQLVIAVAEREVAEQKLKNEVLTQMNAIGVRFNEAIGLAFDKMEERAHNSLKDHVAQQDKDINNVFSELRGHKAWTEAAIRECHEKREAQWDKLQDAMDECQKDCCPRTR